MTQEEMDKLPRRKRLAARLEMIRRRHRKLILGPREALLDELPEQFGDPLEEFSEADDLELVDASDRPH